MIIKRIPPREDNLWGVFVLAKVGFFTGRLNRQAARFIDKRWVASGRLRVFSGGPDLFRGNLDVFEQHKGDDQVEQRQGEENTDDHRAVG